MWYVFDALEIIMGPYDTREQAEADLDLHIIELYLLEQYPNPYVDYIEEYPVETLVRLQNIYNKSIMLSKDRKEMRKQLKDLIERSEKK